MVLEGKDQRLPKDVLISGEYRSLVRTVLELILAQSDRHDFAIPFVEIKSFLQFVFLAFLSNINSCI